MEITLHEEEDTRKSLFKKFLDFIFKGE